MLKVFKKKDKIKYAIILSVMLHCTIIIIVIWSNWIHQPQKSNINSEPLINSFLIDYDTIKNQHNITQDLPKIKILNEKHQDDNISKLEAKPKNKMLNNFKIKSQEINEQHKLKQNLEIKKQFANKNKKELNEKKINNIKIKTDQLTVLTHIKEGNDTNKRSLKQKDKTTTLNVNRQSDNIDDLLDALTNVKNMPKLDNSLIEINNKKEFFSKRAEIYNYKFMLSQAISKKFYNASSYNGKVCDLHINLSPNGVIMSVNSIGGDPELCQAAIYATKLAEIPKPPSANIYEIFKHITLRFSPK